jgi:hypothetical protein
MYNIILKPLIKIILYNLNLKYFKTEIKILISSS